MSLTSLPVRPAALGAWQRLGDALARLDRPTPCQADPGPFVSEKYQERREAVLACDSCPVRTACAEYAVANKEPFHVWGGRDRGARKKESNR